MVIVLDVCFDPISVRLGSAAIAMDASVGALSLVIKVWSMFSVLPRTLKIIESQSKNISDQY